MMEKSKAGLALFVLLAPAFAAWAHAFVDHAEPAVGSQIHGAPTQVKIWFTEKLEPALSKIQVFDTSGLEVDKRDVKIDPVECGLADCFASRAEAGQIQSRVARRLSRHSCHNWKLHV